MSTYRRSGKLAGWLVLVVALATLNYASRFTSGKPPPNTLYHYDTAISGFFFYALALGLVLWIARGLTRRELALQAPASWLRALGLAFATLIVLLVAEVALDSVLNGTSEQGLEPTHWIPSKAAPFALNAVVVVLVAPVVEEFTFRGLGFSLLSRFGAMVALVGTAVAFAADHGLVEGFPALFVFGLGVGFLRMRTDSLYPGMLVHASFNALALVDAFAR